MFSSFQFKATKSITNNFKNCFTMVTILLPDEDAPKDLGIS